MIEILVPSAVAFFVSILTFFSGFGLGTILTPVFIIFFPVDLAIALTGIVHFFNNIFKLILVGRKADKQVVLQFGIPAIIAAFTGAYLLLQVTDAAPLFSYTAWHKTFEVYPVKLTIAILLILFGAMELIPYFNRLQFGKDKLYLGGLLSGFFGGLSGNQGALRSAFLVKAGLSKEVFVATTAVVSTLVDFTRLSVYATRFSSTGLKENSFLILCATLSAITGAYLGNKLLKKVTLKFVQTLVAVMLILFSLALGTGLI
ncbi:MAG: sulfite exporter TauE/SafE family protein [Taibaiella sp.]|jgi:hypothetical protein